MPRKTACDLRHELEDRIRSAREKPAQEELIHKELSDKMSALAEIVSEVKQVQWRITNYSLLLFAATVGVAKLLGPSVSRTPWQIVVSAVFSFPILLVAVVALGMLAKTERDLGYYREHSKLAEELIDDLTGILEVSNQIVVAEHPEFAQRPDYAHSAQENRKVFTRWFRVTIIVAAAAAIVAGLCLIMT